MFISLLLQNWKLAVIGILVLLLAGSGVYITLLRSDKAACVAEKATLTTQLAESQGNLLQLQNDIKAQNTAIDKLKADADARVSAGAAEVKKAKVVAANYKAQAAELAKRPAPQNMSKCDAANQLVNTEIKHVNN